MNTILLKPVFAFHELTEKLKLKIVNHSSLPMKLISTLVLFFVQILQAVFCLPAYVFVDGDEFSKSGKNHGLSQVDYSFRRFFILTIFFLVVLYFAAIFVSRSFFIIAPAVNVVTNYCLNTVKGLDLFLLYYPISNLIIFVIGASFFVFLMVKFGIFSSKKIPHET